MHGYSEFDQGLEKGGSLKNILSLVNWNDCLDKSNEACSSGLDIQPLRSGIKSLRCHFVNVLSSKLRKN